jgi:hypothetical protein
VSPEDDRVSFDGLEPVSDVGAGVWIAPRLCGFGGRVCCIVPAGFAGYVRVLHPPADAGGGLAAWSQVCELTGRIAHPLMQWHKISTAPPTGSQTGASSWPGSDPEVGNLAPAVLADMLEIIAGLTPDPGDCYHAVWDGWGWLPGEVLGPRLSHPQRDYLLFHGPLRAALSIGDEGTADWRPPQSPSLLWPSDRSWLLATEIDFDSTLVGGSAELVEELLQAPRFEAWPVGIDDDLTIDGDRINQ